MLSLELFKENHYYYFLYLWKFCLQFEPFADDTTFSSRSHSRSYCKVCYSAQFFSRIPLKGQVRETNYGWERNAIILQTMFRFVCILDQFVCGFCLHHFIYKVFQLKFQWSDIFLWRWTTFIFTDNCFFLEFFLITLHLGDR